MAKGYAHGTTVTAQQTQAEIMGLLAARGVNKIATMNEPSRFALAFEFDGVPYRISLPLPEPDEPRFTTYKQGASTYSRSEGSAKQLFEKELNRKWRAFGMVIKAKLVAVEEGISSMEAEFIGNVVLASGRTLSETHASELPALAKAGKVAALALPGAPR